MHAAHPFTRPRGFTLVELLVVIGIMAVLMGMLLPVVGRSRAAAMRTECLANMRSLSLAQALYSADNRNYLVYAGNGTEQGSWIGLLQKYTAKALVRRCPADRSVFFSQPIPASSPPRYRNTSYGINNYVSPTHAPSGGATPPKKVTQVRKSSKVVQFAELAEGGSYASADHLHVQDFYFALAPSVTINKIDQQMPLGRHGGKPKSWDAMLNFSFIDGHVESLTIRQVYTDPTINLFDPAAAK